MTRRQRVDSNSFRSALLAAGRQTSRGERCWQTAIRPGVWLALSPRVSRSLGRQRDLVLLNASSVAKARKDRSAARPHGLEDNESEVD